MHTTGIALMYYTYRELLEALQELPEYDLDKAATIYDKTFDVYIPISHTDKTVEDDDVLDPYHPIIVINDPDVQ
jgi:hypothetical protein